MATETVYIGFPKGHTSFTLYGGTIPVREYKGAYIDPSNPSMKNLRVTLYRTHEAAIAKHGDEARKMNTTVNRNDPVKAYRNLQAPTRKFMNFVRNTNYSFSSQEVPAYVIEKGEDWITFDVDLTGEAISKMIKASARPGQSKLVNIDRVKATKASTGTSKSSNDSSKRTPAKLEQASASASVQRIGALTLSGNLTLSDLKRMGFKIMLTDSADTPFQIDTI